MQTKIVALTSCQDYTSPNLPDTINQVIAAIGSPDNLSGLRVMLKPNLISTRKCMLSCTNGKFILAAARWFLDHGARVEIGDSPALGSASLVLDKLGIIDELHQLGIRISNFKDTRKITLANKVKAAMAVDALTCDLLVNLPRVKAHAQTRVTMAVKNCFGCLSGLHKPWWHMVHGGKNGLFAELLLELMAVLPQTITLVDGIEAMHETGPLTGRAYPLQLVGGGWNPLAVDMALLAVLGIAPENSPLHKQAISLSLPGSRFIDLHFPLSHPEDMLATDFIVPEKLTPIRFNPLSFISGLLKRCRIY